MNTIALRIVMVIMALMASIQAYTQIKSEFISGRWQVDMDETMLRMKNLNDRNLDKLPARSQENLKNGFNGRQFFFDKENKMVLGLKVKDQPKELDGEWFYDEKKMELTMSFNGNPKKFKLKSEGNNMMILDYDKKRGDAGTLSFLCLRRIN